MIRVDAKLGAPKDGTSPIELFQVHTPTILASFTSYLQIRCIINFRVGKTDDLDNESK